MTRSAKVAQLSSAFDDFLFAPITDDGHGMPLSVLSAMARLNVDPWQEAANLALLPKADAIQRLGNLIAELPGETPAHPGPVANAASLIRLLPHQAEPIVATREGVFAVGTKPNWWAIAYVVVMAFMLGLQLFAENGKSSVQAHSSHVPTAVMVSPRPTPQPDLGG